MLGYVYITYFPQGLDRALQGIETETKLLHFFNYFYKISNNYLKLSNAVGPLWNI